MSVRSYPPHLLVAGAAIAAATALAANLYLRSSSSKSSSSSSSSSSTTTSFPVFAVSGPWFAGVNPSETSAASNSCLEEWKSYTGPAVYSSSDARASTGVPYVDIIDNTEGIAGVADLHFPPGPLLLVDVGGGKSDAAKQWCESKHPGLTYLVADPFGRSASHNEGVQSAVEAAGGADVAASVSVLNVVRDPGVRSRHVAVVHKCLKVGGWAYFKVWAGVWPNRGTAVGTYDPKRDIYQANRWARGFKEEVEAYFGVGNVIVDDARNLLIAMKKK